VLFRSYGGNHVIKSFWDSGLKYVTIIYNRT
jgi:hypothetical protein